MSVLITADIHLSDNPRDEYRHTFMELLPGVAQENNAELILILGDLTEAKGGHSEVLVNRLVEHIADLSTQCPVVITTGNHDWLSSPQTPFFKFLAHLPEVFWVGAPERLDMRHCWDEARWGSALALPHTTNYKRDWETLDFNNLDWIFAHNTFKGADTGSGFQLDGIPLDVFPEDARVISGDVHHAQTLGPVTYVGSPYSVDFGDSHQPRIFLIKGSKTLKSVPITGPQKRLIEIDWFADLLDQPQLVAGDVLKVRVRLQSEWQAVWQCSWEEVKQIIREWGAERQVTVHTVEPVVDSSRNARSKRSKAIAVDDKTLLETYSAQRGVDEKTKKTGLKILGA